ncbi:PucR family transcriptional regulator [Amycolatopsis rhizosphaerae]|uniref:PucR family transcriptional regulator n=1 Tax=Amycolatopsis rhizosphaerae TaxID=2053003 RepID=A0A558C0N8_9PSEU|nr:helix-turn-helix domain-containing protein [Amycolatopsis rhizosphaerae]TVT42303.1 PucR family transcriptional regulator [Amycolatopsis rhizosphaerae]
MAGAQERERVGEVLLAMAADSSVVDKVARAARAASPDVARLPASENLRHIAVLLEAGLAALRGTGEPDFTAAAVLGADRAAQGVPITALLQGVQAGRRCAVEIAIERGRAAGLSPEAMLEAMLDFDHYADALERQVISGYHTAELELSRTVRDARTQLLRRLLHGDALTGEELASAGLHPDCRYHCLLSDVSDPVQARSLEQRLSGCGGVFGLVEGRLTGLAARLPATAGFGSDALVVAAPAAALPDIRARYTWCGTALTAAQRRGLRGLHHLTDLAGETALAAQPALASLLAETLLGALDPGDAFHRQLACTALAYLDHGRRLDQTAAALHIHANTVRYRLGRLAEITGASLEASPAVLPTLRWWWALHTWLTDPPTAHRHLPPA